MPTAQIWNGSAWVEIQAAASAHHAAHEPGGADAMAVDAAAATASLRTLGTGAAQSAAGNHAHSGTYVPVSLTQNAQTGTTYTLALTDVQKLVELANASAITLTVPPNSSVAFPVGTQVHLLQSGAGQVTVAPGSGVTINGTPGLKARAQWSAITVIKRATDTWVAIGDLAA